MASLIADALAERALSRQLRAQAESLRFASRRRHRESQKRQAVCLTTWAHARRLRMRGVPSPWSGLAWQQPDAELDRVILVVPDGE